MTLGTVTQCVSIIHYNDFNSNIQFNNNWLVPGRPGNRKVNKMQSKGEKHAKSDISDGI